MNSQDAPSIMLRDLPSEPDFRVGPLFASPSRRLIEGPAGSATLQPQVMLVFLCLAKQLNRVITRRALFDHCWGNLPVGDDSLNQALSAIRHALRTVGADHLSIETVPRTGYRLSLEAEAGEGGPTRDSRAHNAFDCWRAGLPKADTEEIDALEAHLLATSGVREWGTLSLLLRKAAEYAEASDCASFVTRCEQAARRALKADPRDGDALVALAGLTPLYGNWADVRLRLTEVYSSDPANVPARHDLAVLEMATGRPSAAIPLIEQLLGEDGLAAAFHYKRMYHLWAMGDVAGMELAAARALQLWPRHPAIWAARFWTLLFTRRAEHALCLALDAEGRPAMPAAAADFLVFTANLVAARQAGKASAEGEAAHVERCLKAVTIGPAHAVSALLSLCALERIDEAFTIARAYYLGDGPLPVPLRWRAGDPSITDQHRRVTQPLFIPAAQAMREDPRFMPLCEDMGLAAYWERFAITPDFLCA